MQRATLRALGLRRIRHEVVQEDSASVRGMLNKVGHMVTVVEEQTAPARPARARRTRAVASKADEGVAGKTAANDGGETQ